MLTYSQSIEYLESFINYEKIAAPYDPRKWKLERMYYILNALGNPHQDLNFIHVAGTKGKGSTSAMIASILKEAGYKVGLYTSPHLVSFRERICINGEMITENQVCELVAIIKPYVAEIKKHEDQLGILSFFEIYTILCFLFFNLEKVDFAVMEVGMGGRLDATNVINPLVSVITQISFDHILSLGNTIEAIATEKAGIIKDDGYVITSPQLQEAMQVIENKCAEKRARLFKVGKDVTFIKKENAKFSVSGLLDNYEDLYIPLIGDHQFINASTAIGAMELLHFHRYHISEEYIKSGLEKLKWLARVEVIHHNPEVILDVAHNEASAKSLKEAIKANFIYEKLIMVIGASIQKDVKGMAQHLCPIANEVILTKANSPRAMSTEEVRTEISEICRNVIITPNVEEAIKKAKSMAGPKDLICITGSFYIAGEVMEIIGRNPDVFKHELEM